MNNLRKRIISLVTAAALAFTSVGALPDIGGFELPDLTVQSSALEAVSYIDVNGNPASCTDYTVVTSDATAWNGAIVVSCGRPC